MHLFLEAIILLVTFSLYWINRSRRKHLKKRIGSKALANIYQNGRDLSFVLQRKKLHLKGNIDILQKGGVLYSFHFGVWELMPKTLKELGYPLAVVVNRYQTKENNFLAKFADRFLYHFRTRNGINIFYREESMKIVRFIKSGGLLGILVDGNTFYAKFKKAQKLARICNVPLIPFAAYQQNGQGILAIDCNLSQLVERNPLNYLWAYRSRK